MVCCHKPKGFPWNKLLSLWLPRHAKLPGYVCHVIRNELSVWGPIVLTATLIALHTQQTT